MWTRAALIVSFLFAGSGAAMATTTETAGTDVAIALPLIAAGITVYKGDWTGTAELGLDGFATVGTA